MPPGPAYNWLCVLHTTAEILSNIARHRAVPVNRIKPSRVERVGRREPDNQLEHASYTGTCNVARDPPSEPRIETVPSTVLTGEEPASSILQHNPVKPTNVSPESEPVVSYELQSAAPSDDIGQPIPSPNPSTPIVIPPRTLQSSRVPSSRIGRLFHYGGLAASLGYGAAVELARRTGNISDESRGSLIMNEANIRRLVSKLSQMRGAALKLGQFLSIQDTHLLPPDIDAIFRRVQDSAHYMPDSQLNQSLSSELGKDWETKYFSSFDHIPFAAASIGQVHSASLLSHATSTYPITNTSTGIPVAVKVQFPNISNSIDSDLSYVRMLLTASKILPKGMFLERTVEVMRSELADECLYTREASFLKMFGEFLKGDNRFKVPWVWEGSTDGVLVMERVEGISVGEAKKMELKQEDRDDIAARIIELCLKELFQFRVMQTDPNWTNFLWNPNTRQIELVDFGATRSYDKGFIDNWLRLLQAAASEDRDACKEWSLKLGYLTGEENDTMLDAHITSMSLLASPFKSSTPQPFAFGPDSKWAEITKQIRSFIPVMLQHRLTPPPRETYSLNRKLSGAFLLAARLDATVDTKAVWDKVVSQYQFDTE
ncbi:hypothetical protein Agabi119p4_11049 [Agaricus bisporus var. burnettii]|uniref:ABC1 atypical kinase-like domain-containing protein n=1 Tax=Agaricus bisporus var. burnettii TaxID=192524 RepID=A0A8H7EVQ1_AGABI|nr:hypothetical protein Agabi119p4_11049 [Agaricus bisporus var. burnettii]